MTTRLIKVLLVLALGGLGLVAVSCGGDGDSTSAQSGGTLNMLDTAGGVDSLDPGYWYYQTDYQQLGEHRAAAAVRLEARRDQADPRPRRGPAGGLERRQDRDGQDQAEHQVQRSSPEPHGQVSRRQVRARALLPAAGRQRLRERLLRRHRGREGVHRTRRPTRSPGIETPDDQTLVINTTEPVGVLADGGALGMPCTVPVPKDYAQKYDEGKQSTYGQHQVFTGPYMIENDGKGKVTGYEPSKRLTLVRNPSWEKSTDFKPAYFDRIVETCCSDATVAARKTLSGQGYLSGDYAAPPVAVLKQALSSRKDQISVESERRQPLHLAQHDREAARQRERASGDQRRDRPERPAADPRRPDPRARPPPTSCRRASPASRRRAARRAPASTSRRTRRRTSRSRSSTCRRRATRTACTTARRC